MDNHLLNLEQLLYHSSTLYDVSEKYIDMIKDDNPELAKKIEKYNSLRFQCLKESYDSLSTVENIQRNWYFHILSHMPKTYVKCEGRIKGFLSGLIKYLYTQSMRLPLSTVRDAVGIRFILYDNSFYSCQKIYCKWSFKRRIERLVFIIK